MISKSELLIMTLMFMVVLGVVLSLPIMLLWNYCLVPAVPIATEITWLQAWGLFVLFGLLFRNNSTFGE
jgi:hypothetical protein